MSSNFYRGYMKFLKFILEQLSQGSTVRGILMVVGALGVTLSPELATQIVTATIASSGALGILMSENK